MIGLKEHRTLEKIGTNQKIAYGLTRGNENVMRKYAQTWNTKKKPRATNKSIGLNLAGSHGFRDKAPKRKLLFLQVFGSRFLNFQLGHSIAQSSFNLITLATLEIERPCWV